VYKDSQKIKEEKSAKSKRVRRVLRERLDSLSLKEKRLACLPASCYIYSIGKANSKTVVGIAATANL
jgi:hypothetical protein